MSALLDALQAALPAGCEVHPALGPSPSSVWIVLPGTGIAGEPGTEHMIVLAEDFNVPDGWEAALDTGGDQYGLPDGPSTDAPDAEVVAWVAGLVSTALAEHDNVPPSRIRR